MYRLKKNAPAFEVVDGEFAGRKFEHGQNYAEIPEAEKERFEKVRTPLAAGPVREKAGEEEGGKKK